MIDKNQEPLFRGIFFVWLLFLGIALPIILSVRDLFYEKEEMGRLVTYPLGISLGCLVIWRYTKKKEMILKEYKECKYNKIPNWVFGILITLLWISSFAVGIYLYINLFQPYMEMHNLIGYFC